MSDLATAYLPGVGFLVDPQPADYRRAIRFLWHKGLPAHARQKSLRISQGSLLDRLEATARRLEWAPKRERTMNKRKHLSSAQGVGVASEPAQSSLP